MDVAAPTPPLRRQRLWERLPPARARFWAVLGIHLGAFAVLYLGAFGLIERASAEAGATAARFQLDDAVRQMPFLWMGSNPRATPHLVAAHQSIGLHLYRRDGTLANAADISPDPAEIARVREFLPTNAASDSWVSASRAGSGCAASSASPPASGACPAMSPVPPSAPRP